MTLKPEDMRLYIKRLRKLVKQRFKTSNVKYYYAGEYGTANRRPHYHMLIFNVPDVKCLSEAWTLNGIPIGTIDVGNVEQDSIAYTMKYIDKSTWKVVHWRDDRYPEFSRSSQKLGLNYLTPEIKQWHRSSNDHLFCSLHAGHRIALPRYYKKKIFTDDEIKNQLPHIQQVIQTQDNLDRERHADLYRGTDITYEHIVDQRRFMRYKNFYHRQKLKSRK